MNNSDNDGGMFGFRQVAQRENLTGGYAGEIKIPVMQSFIAIVFACLAVLFAWLLLFIIGPDVLWCAGFVVIIIVARRVLLWIGTAQQETREEINGVRAMTIGVCAVALTLTGTWLASRPFCVSIWSIVPPTYSPWRIVFAVSFIIIPIIVCAFTAMHFLIESFNPAAFQPHQAKPAGTPWWSPTGQYIEETESDDEYPPAQIIRDVPRPIPAYFANPNGNQLQRQIQELSYTVNRAPKELPAGAFKAPNGRIARIEDLAEFLIDGVMIGATYQTWHKRKNWSESYWQAMIGTCAQHGFAKIPRLKSRSRLLVKSKREAAQAIEHLRRYLFKTHAAPEAENTPIS